MNNQKGVFVEAAIEELCSQGCNEVNSTIRKLEQNLDVSEVKQLNSADKHLVLTELKSIMSVYDGKNK